MRSIEDEAGGEGGDAAQESFESLCVAELTNMESDFKRWQKLMFSAYQSQAQIFFKVSGAGGLARERTRLNECLFLLYVAEAGGDKSEDKA